MLLYIVVILQGFFAKPLQECYLRSFTINSIETILFPVSFTTEKNVKIKIVSVCKRHSPNNNDVFFGSLIYFFFLGDPTSIIITLLFRLVMIHIFARAFYNTVFKTQWSSEHSVSVDLNHRSNFLTIFGHIWKEHGKI